MTPQARQALERAVALHRAGDLPQAETLYQEVLRHDSQQADALHLLGVIAHQRGDAARAVDLISQAIKRDARNAHSHLHLAQACRALRRVDDAIAAAKKSIKLDPQNAEAHHELGRALADAGRIDEAVAEYERVIKLEANPLSALLNAGGARFLQGRLDAALTFFERAVSFAPNSAEAHNNLGSTLFHLGQAAAAQPHIERALALKPDYPEALINFGNLLRQLQQHEAAIAAYNRALALQPDNMLALFNRGNALAESGRRAEALVDYDRVLAIQPDYAEALSNKAAVVGELGDPRAAVELARQAVRLMPNFADGYNNLGVNLMEAGFFQEAFLAYQRAMELKPGYEAPYLNMAKLMWTIGDAPAGMRYLLEVLKTHPEHAEAQRALLLYDLYLYRETPPKPTPVSFGAPPARELFAQRKDKHKKIRLAYLSSDFRLHPVGRNIWAVLEAHDRQQFELYLYGIVPTPDALTERFAHIADKYQNVAGMSDADIAALMRRDEVDVLVILAARFDSNKPLVAAHRAAPVQVSFHDPASSYLADMDYLITDITMNPRDTQEFFTERLIHLPTFYLHPPLTDAPPIPPPPMLARGHVTFGSFNNVAKLNPQVIALWSEVLKAVPDSRLVMKYKEVFDDPFVHQHYMEMFAAHGIEPARVQMITENLNFTQHLARYADIDIALDPFPFAGSTTTFEALWMGVPVVTLAGNTMLSRWGVSMLRRVGLPELAAATMRDYVSIAAQLAANPDRLVALRASLRERVARSPLCDARRRTRQLDRVFRWMWLKWCSEN